MQIASHDSGNATQPFTAKRLSDALAAEIEGVDLSQPIDGTMKDAIYDALLQHHVLVFRDQTLTREQQGTFATNYGELEGHVGRLRNGERYPVINDITNIQPDGKKVPELVNRGPNHWHTDKSYHEIPSAITMLHGKQVPSKGGETLFANMRLAYEALPPDMKARVDDLKVVHSWEANRKNVGETPATEDQKRERPPVTHPLIRTHPDTGTKALYIGTHIDKIVDMSRADSDALVEELMEHSIQPQFRYDHAWRQGDLVMWDNRSLMHRGNTNYDMANESRVLQRTVIIGTKPF
ncbi:MAG: TauD/TfdA family dioxygenase [Rhodospirillaceae bacterium]|nr:TauD/TfdA family dioxygenase [Rhodospirillaceae bacterium]MDD9926416.1 TauD/TfdA family dioxygenase [Rhodospirillaceae bacterium]